MAEAALLVAAGSRATGSALYGVTGDGVGGLVGVTALSALEGDGGSDAAFLSETVFILRRATAAKRAAYPDAC